MRVPRFAIDNHQFTLVLISMLILMGIVSFSTMPRSEDPQVQPAGGSVIVIYPGASPADIEELIVKPLEDAINELEDIRYLSSTAKDGIGTIGVEFLPGSDPDEKFDKLVQKVNTIRPSLPENIYSLDMWQWTISEVNIYQFAMVSETAPYPVLQKEAERLTKQLEKIPGVLRSEIFGIPDRQVLVSLDMEKLALMHIPLSAVIGAVQDANTNIPGGYVDMGTRRLQIKTSGSYENLEDVRNTLIHSTGGKSVFLKDIADIELTDADLTYEGRLNGTRAVFLTLQQKEKTNIIHIAGQVQPVIDEFSRTLPASVSLETVFDQSESVHFRINDFFINLLQGIILVGIVILGAVSWRAALIVMIAIPVSNLIGIFFVHHTGHGLQQITIAGLVIALGLLVDNAIVVTENIARYLHMGYSRRDAAVTGTEEVGWAVASATATTVFAFIPIIMLKDVTGDFIRSMPVTVVATLAASLMVSLTLTPYLSSRFLKVAVKTQPHRIRIFLNHFVETAYRSSLSWCLGNPGKVIVISAAAFVLSLAMFPLLGVSFFPKAEKPMFFINIDLPQGTNIDQTSAITHYVECGLDSLDDVRLYASSIGHGNPRIYYNMIPSRNNPAHAQILVQLKERDRDMLRKNVSLARSLFEGIPGAQITVKELEQGPPVTAPIEIQLLGENLEKLSVLAADVEKIIANEPGVINTYNPLSTRKTDLRLNINRSKANMLGVSLTEIDRTVRTAMNGLRVSGFRDKNGKDYDIVFRLPTDQKTKYSDFNHIYVASGNGSLVPLLQIASVELIASPLRINHYKMDRSVAVTADVEAGVSATEATKGIIKNLEIYPWPKGYEFYAAGEMENQAESFGGMKQAVLIALIAIFGVLVLQFKSYRQPLIVFSAIPLAVIGAIWGLFLSGNSFSFTAFVGITSLVGIVVNNAIILMDYTNQLRRKGTNMADAVQQAGETRFVPIILTTLTTIGGLLPLTVRGGTLWAPMGWTIIGGLLCSTMLTLLVVPTLYTLVEKNSVRTAA